MFFFFFDDLPNEFRCLSCLDEALLTCIMCKKRKEAVRTSFVCRRVAPLSGTGFVQWREIPQTFYFITLLLLKLTVQKLLHLSGYNLNLVWKRCWDQLEDKTQINKKKNSRSTLIHLETIIPKLLSCVLEKVILIYKCSVCVHTIYRKLWRFNCSLGLCLC